MIYTLRHTNEIRSMDAIDELADIPAKVKPEEVKLAHQMMSTFENDVDLQEYRDDYQMELHEIINAKIEKREIVAQKIKTPPKMINLMETLHKNLNTINAKKKKAATPIDTITAPKKKKT